MRKMMDKDYICASLSIFKNCDTVLPEEPLSIKQRAAISGSLNAFLSSVDVLGLEKTLNTIKERLNNAKQEQQRR